MVKRSVISPAGAGPAPVSSRPSYQDVDRLVNSDGIVGVISQRSRNGVLTFAVWREFERDGHLERTQFVEERFAAAYIDMVQMVIARMKVLRASGSLPFPT